MYSYCTAAQALKAGCQVGKGILKDHNMATATAASNTTVMNATDKEGAAAACVIDLGGHLAERGFDLDAFAAQLQSCTGAPFERSDSGPLAVARVGEDDGEARCLRTVSWATTNFKGERRVAAVLLLERSSSASSKEEEWVACTLFITTCDPFGLDNFTQPLGASPDSAGRAQWDLTGKKVTLCNTVKTVEQRVFLERKVRDHMDNNLRELAWMTPDAFYAVLQKRAIESRFLSSTGLREILGDEFAGEVPTAESLRTPDTTKEAFEAMEKAEKAALRNVVAELEPVVFYARYNGWLRYVAGEMPINLLPAEYKKRGRWVLLSMEEAARWNRCVFLYLLGVRAEVVLQSPFESALPGCGWAWTRAATSPRCPTTTSALRSRPPRRTASSGRCSQTFWPIRARRRGSSRSPSTSSSSRVPL
jgi:hypothetical protein